MPWDEIVKGYEYEKGEYVILTDEDFKKVNPEATQSVDILEFVELDKINPMYFDKPYYLEPTKQGKHAYALLARSVVEQQARRNRARRDTNEGVYRCGKTIGRSARARVDALGR